MPLFNRGHEPASDEQAVADFPIEATLAHFTPLAVPERAAEILTVIRVEKVQAVAPYYLLGADGRAALDRGDATQVIARRLPD